MAAKRMHRRLVNAESCPLVQAILTDVFQLTGLQSRSQTALKTGLSSGYILHASQGHHLDMTRLYGRPSDVVKPHRRKGVHVLYAPLRLTQEAWRRGRLCRASGIPTGGPGTAGATESWQSPLADNIDFRPAQDSRKSPRGGIPCHFNPTPGAGACSGRLRAHAKSQPPSRLFQPRYHTSIISCFLFQLGVIDPVICCP